LAFLVFLLGERERLPFLAFLLGERERLLFLAFLLGERERLEPLFLVFLLGERERLPFLAFLLGERERMLFLAFLLGERERLPFLAFLLGERERLEPLFLSGCGAPSRMRFFAGLPRPRPAARPVILPRTPAGRGESGGARRSLPIGEEKKRAVTWSGGQNVTHSYGTR